MTCIEDDSGFSETFQMYAAGVSLAQQAKYGR